MIFGKRPPTLGLLGGLLAVLLGGCDVFRGEAGGLIQAQSLGRNAVRVEGEIVTAIYTDRLSSELSFFMADRSIDELMEADPGTAQVLRVELLWEPQPGRTPVDEYATNASLQYVIMVDGELGIYSGGGFAAIDGGRGDERIYILLRNTTLRLQDHTPGFVDQLGPTLLTGSLVAEYRPELARQLHRRISQFATDSLGKTRIVLAPRNKSLAHR